ncbi:hypothetical protein [Hyphomicrobium methylovorum]|uniref:hypothetical protein n=1 Tax=Hyphomicrobium methylovorum TaxID=84 RepID=UPI0015E67BE3|nr:hypothetical protein [Hyphomicrobium methylovorum]
MSKDQDQDTADAPYPHSMPRYDQAELRRRDALEIALRYGLSGGGEDTDQVLARARVVEAFICGREVNAEP